MDTIRVAQYFKMTVPHRVGVAASALRALSDAGVNLVAFSGFPRGRAAQLDFIVSDAAAFKAAAKRANVKVEGPKACLVFSGEDRAGAVADLLQRLGDAKINVTALDAACAGDGRYGGLLWVQPRDVKKAARLLAAHEQTHGTRERHRPR
jgi:hypothetical protein